MSLNSFCPDCNKYPQLDVKDNLKEIEIQCKCGYKKTLLISNYLNMINNIKPIKKNYSNDYQRYKDIISKAYQHLNIYFT